LSSLTYDPDFPLFCFDERPYFLIGDTVATRSMQTRQVRKEHYAYEKLGSCALLAAIQPLTGYRLGQVHARRTKKEYPLFMQALTAAFPPAVKLRVVQDNVNTHAVSAFYEHLPADEARTLAERIESFTYPNLRGGSI
jgi:hypothetical protein